MEKKKVKPHLKKQSSHLKNEKALFLMADMDRLGKGKSSLGNRRGVSLSMSQKSFLCLGSSFIFRPFFYLVYYISFRIIGWIIF